MKILVSFLSLLFVAPAFSKLPDPSTKPVCHYGGETYQLYQKPSEDTVCEPFGQRAEVVDDPSAFPQLHGNEAGVDENIKVLENHDVPVQATSVIN